MASTQNQKTASGGRVAGSLNALSRGLRGSADWCAIMSGFLPRLLACTWLCLRVSCSINGWPVLVLDQFSRSSH